MLVLGLAFMGAALAGSGKSTSLPKEGVLYIDMGEFSLGEQKTDAGAESLSEDAESEEIRRRIRSEMLRRQVMKGEKDTCGAGPADPLLRFLSDLVVPGEKLN